MGILNHLKEKINPVVEFGDVQGAQPTAFAKFHYRASPFREEIFLVSMILLSCLFGFGLGRFSKLEERKAPIEIEMPISAGLEGETASVSTSVASSDVYYVASKNGTKYYFPWCEGAKKISPKNLVKYGTKELAESAGLQKAANCAGL